MCITTMVMMMMMKDSAWVVITLNAECHHTKSMHQSTTYHALMQKKREQEREGHCGIHQYDVLETKGKELL